MFAAIRLPAARRLAATVLRAMITGSVNFISTLLVAILAMGRFYRSSDEPIRHSETHARHPHARHPQAFWRGSGTPSFLQIFRSATSETP